MFFLCYNKDIMRNTKDETTLNFAIIPGEKKGNLTALCFELGLVIEDKVTEVKDIFELKERIEKAAWNYFATVIEDDDLNDDLLNQSLPEKYQPILKEIKMEELRKEWENKLNKIIGWNRQASQEGLKV